MLPTGFPARRTWQSSFALTGYWRFVTCLEDLRTRQILRNMPVWPALWPAATWFSANANLQRCRLSSFASLLFRHLLYCCVAALLVVCSGVWSRTRLTLLPNVFRINMVSLYCFWRGSIQLSEATLVLTQKRRSPRLLAFWLTGVPVVIGLSNAKRRLAHLSNARSPL